MKRLLVLARDFAPSTRIGGQRPLKLVRRIREFGWEPYVLTAPTRCQQPVDLGIGQDVLSTTHIETVPCWSLWRHTEDWRIAPNGWRKTLSMMGKLIAKLTYPLVPIDVDYPWMLAASRRAVSMVRRYHIDLIWATTPPLSCLSLARHIRQKTGVPCVVDFRDVRHIADPLHMPRRLKSIIAAEGDALRDAAGLTYVSPPQVDILTQRHPFLAELPRCLIYNWFESTEAATCRPRHFERPTIVHGGSLYSGQRRLDGFMSALAILRQRDPEGVGGVRFLHHGGPQDVAYLERHVSDHDVGEMVELRPSLPRGEFLSACHGARILLLVVGGNMGIQEHAGAIPGKLYDYFFACRPILVVGPPDCEAARLVTRLNRGLAAADDSPEQIANALERLLRGEGESDKPDLTLDAVREFESSYAVEKMAKFFFQVAVDQVK